MVTNNIDIAILNYEAKLKAKSQSGDYRIVEMNYEADEENEEKPEPK